MARQEGQDNGLKQASARDQEPSSQLFSSGPSIRMERMEKKAAAEQKRAWQASDVDTVTETLEQPPGLSQMICCPCVNYARTNARMFDALKGQGVEKPDVGFFSGECIKFTLCFPFYGVMVGKLQGTVRAFYGIEGTDKGDLADGCCCPCAVIARNEEELAFRQKVKSLHDLGDQKRSGEYKSQVPMAYGSPRVDQASQVASPPPAKSANFNGNDPDHDVPALQSIPESGSAAIPLSLLKPNIVAGGQEKKKTKKSKTTSEESGHVVRSPNTERAIIGKAERAAIGRALSPIPVMQYLGRRWYLVPMDSKENTEKSEEGDDLKSEGDHSEHRAEKPGPKAPLEGALQAVQERSANILNQIRQHASSPDKEKTKPKPKHPRQPSQEEPHNENSPVVPHTLDQDQTHAEAPGPRIHFLENEEGPSKPANTPQEVGGPAQGQPSKHTLPEVVIRSPEQKEIPEALERVPKPVIEHGKSRFTEHLLEDDHVFFDRPVRSGSPHFLSADAMVSRIHAMGSPHVLEDEPSKQPSRVTDVTEPVHNKPAEADGSEAPVKLAEPAPHNVEPPKQKVHLKEKGESMMRKGLKGLMRRSDAKSSEASSHDDTPAHKEPDVSNTAESQLPGEPEGAWMKSFWPGAFPPSPSQPARAVHDIDDDVRVTTRPEVSTPHGIDIDPRQETRPEPPTATENKDIAAKVDAPADAKDAGVNDKPAETANAKPDDTVITKPAEAVLAKPARVTGSKIAKAASQLFGTGTK